MRRRAAPRATRPTLPPATLVLEPTYEGGGWRDNARVPVPRSAAAGGLATLALLATGCGASTPTVPKAVEAKYLTALRADCRPTDAVGSELLRELKRTHEMPKGERRANAESEAESTFESYMQAAIAHAEQVHAPDGEQPAVHEVLTEIHRLLRAEERAEGLRLEGKPISPAMSEFRADTERLDASADRRLRAAIFCDRKS